MTDGDLALSCASLLVDELVRAGMRHACVSPGSRSAPIALALSRNPDVRVHVVLDERSAGFMALGIAKSSGKPAAVACTSGTAAANLLPPVVEASYARVPLVVLTADRPPELRDVGANQTIDQLRLFGAYPRWFADVPVPESRQDTVRVWRSLGARAAAAASGRPPGPVHLNLAFREPLVPSGRPIELGPGREDGLPWEQTILADDDIPDLGAVPVALERGLIVAAGPDLDAGAVDALAFATGWPVIAEPVSGVRRPRWHVLSAAQHLLAAGFASSNAPDVVVLLGAPVTSRATLALLAAAGRLVVVDPHDPPNAARRAATRVVADPSAAARALASRVRRPESSWIEQWTKADQAARRIVDESLDADDEPFEPRIVRDVAAAVPRESCLVCASSMPIRDLDAFMSPRDELRVLSNRGVSGIDGFVSTVLGVGAATESRTFALAGDLSLLHDAGALLWSADRGHSAVIVVLNNNGGGVFDHLDHARLPEHERLFVAPHGLDLRALALAARASYERVERAGDVAGVLLGAPPGVTIVEVPIDRASGMARRERLARRLAGESFA